MAPSPRRDEALGMALLTVLAAAWHLGWRGGLAAWWSGLSEAERPVEVVSGALGTDAVLWGLTAADLSVGASPLVPPLYPGVVALLHGVAGIDLVAAGTGLSLACAIVLPAAVLWAARRAGATLLPALVAAMVVLLSPDLGEWAHQLQPELPTVLTLTVQAGLLSLALGGDRRASWGATVLAGVLPLLREHGLPVAALSGVVLLLAPGARLARLGTLVGLVWALPVVLGWSSGWPPGGGPWSERSGGALTALTTTSTDAVPYVRELPRAQREAYLALVREGDVVGRLRWHLGRSWSLAWDGWFWLGLAGVAGGLGAARRKALLGPTVLLVSAVPALLIWSQRRHVTLLLVVAWIVLAAAVQALPWRRLVGAALVVALVALTWSWPGRWSTLATRQLAESAHASHQAEVGRWICGHRGEGAALLGGVHQDVGLACPLPRHDPDGSDADWLTWYVGEASPGARWEAVHRAEQGGLAVWRLEPERSPRPCKDATPPADAAHLAVGRAAIEVTGCLDPAEPLR